MVHLVLQLLSHLQKQVSIGQWCRVDPSNASAIVKIVAANRIGGAKDQLQTPMFVVAAMQGSPPVINKECNKGYEGPKLL